MSDSLDPTINNKPVMRCSECDREVTHYNTFVSASDKPRVICWQCVARDEKGFNADRNFHRISRRGVIPR